MLPPCPYLPTPRPGLDWRSLHAYRAEDRGEEFYYACLEYGHALWIRGLPARGLLCLDRAFGADLQGSEPMLRQWPMPYAATRWFLTHGPDDRWVGNPRVHFQHYADRMNEPRRDQRRWRAWGCWALTRVVRPDLPPDPLHPVAEPSTDVIYARLREFGVPGEADEWRSALGGSGAPAGT